MPICCCDFVYITRDYVLNTCHVSQVTEYTVIGLVIFTPGSVFIVVVCLLFLSCIHILPLALLFLSAYWKRFSCCSQCSHEPSDYCKVSSSTSVLLIVYFAEIRLCLDFDESGNYLELAFSSCFSLFHLTLSHSFFFFPPISFFSSRTHTGRNGLLFLLFARLAPAPAAIAAAFGCNISMCLQWSEKIDAFFEN